MDINNLGNTWKVYVHTVPKKISGYKYDKHYVGITGKDPKERWRDGKGYKNGIFKKAIKKYGWDNIKHKIVAENLSHEEACELEKELIKKYKSFGERGYNATEGGEGRGYYINCNQPAYDTWYRMTKRFEKTKKDTDRYAEEWEDPSIFSKWAVENGQKPNCKLVKKNKKGHYCPSNCCFRYKKYYTYNGITGCIADWAEITGLTRRTIEGRLQRNPDNFEHAIHEYIENDCQKVTPKHTCYNKGICILQYDLNGNYIKEYDFIIDCANALGVDPKYVSRAIKGDGLLNGYRLVKKHN